MTFIFCCLQEVVLELLNQWKEENPGERFYLRLKGDNNVDDGK